MNTKLLKRTTKYKLRGKVTLRRTSIILRPLILQKSFSNNSNISVIAALIKSGEIAAIPTETVYGLAANAFSASAIKKIFEAKNRPNDNPLIVHINSINQITTLASEFPIKAQKLADAFWPGPLTIILNKSSAVLNDVTAGLPTVAIRMPAHPLTLELIGKAGVPLAAPSANLSGSPSPTRASHVIDDLSGKIPAILDGGGGGGGGESNCAIGLESTIITLAQEPPCLLRPGQVTVEQIEAIIGKIEVNPAVFEPIQSGATVLSPGTKYKHYAPKATLYIVRGSNFVKYVNEFAETRNQTAALCYEEDRPNLRVFSINYGHANDESEQAKNLFAALRQFDNYPQIKTILARCPEPKGIGLAVYNRLIRAAGFKIIDL